jgi:hypothetical protein
MMRLPEQKEPAMHIPLAFGYVILTVVAIYTVWDIYQSRRYRRAIEERRKRAG